MPDKPKSHVRSRLTILKQEREIVRQCFLFSNHLIITSRTQAGRLHLVDDIGRISLAEVILTEEPCEDGADEDSSLYSSDLSYSSLSDLSNASYTQFKQDYQGLDFKLTCGNGKEEKKIIHLAAQCKQEKFAWIADISQCMDNVHFDNLYNNTLPHISSSSVPQFVKSDPSLFKDDVDIRFSRSLNNCKVPQIRYATPERLLQRLTDLRFLSIDFLNTFLLTYKVFADGVQVLEALKKVFFNPEQVASPTSSCGSLDDNFREEPGIVGSAKDNLHVSVTCQDTSRRISTCSGYSTGPELAMMNLSRQGSNSPRRISGASTASGYYSDDKDRHTSIDSGSGTAKSQHWRYSFRKCKINIFIILIPIILSLYFLDEEDRRESKEDKELVSRDSPIRVSVSSASGGNQWRKESVTIVEGQEPGEDEQEAGDKEEEVEEGDVIKEDLSAQCSSISMEDSVLETTHTQAESFDRQQLLSIPSSSMANSSSAETLTDNTITGGESPTPVSPQRSRAYSENDNDASSLNQTRHLELKANI